MYSVSELLETINSRLEALRFARTPEGLYTPISYVLSIGGKRIRPVLLMMAYNLYKERLEPVLAPAMGIEMYHNYTLLHDDLMDRADRRRGKETVHKVWGDNTAILSGDAMLVLAYQLIAQVPPESLGEVLDLFSLTALEICEGQQMDMEFEQRKDVSEDEYLEMIRLKTSVLLAAALKIGAILGGASKEDADRLYDLGINMGIAFQLKDDLLDVYGNPEVFGKNIGGDILCNKKTYLLIKAYEHADKAQMAELDGWLNATSYAPEEKIAAVTRLYNKIGVKEMCERKMSVHNQLALVNLSAVSLPEERKKHLVKLVEDLLRREV